ncbi:MAG: septal ring lytic transglycosylase RlpA family protein [Ginsengibacter sp.]
MGKILKVWLFIIFSLFFANAYSQTAKNDNKKIPVKKSVNKKQSVFFGLASYYAAKFHGRKTANGERYDVEKLTAACNILPLNTWIKVTNLRNNKVVFVKINDRMHHANKRLVDLSKAAAAKLGYLSKGLTKVKLEVLRNYNPTVNPGKN